MAGSMVPLSLWWSWRKGVWVCTTSRLPSLFLLPASHPPPSTPLPPHTRIDQRGNCPSTIAGIPAPTARHASTTHKAQMITMPAAAAESRLRMWRRQLSGNTTHNVTSTMTASPLASHCHDVGAFDLDAAPALTMLLPGCSRERSAACRRCLRRAMPNAGVLAAAAAAWLLPQLARQSSMTSATSPMRLSPPELGPHSSAISVTWVKRCAHTHTAKHTQTHTHTRARRMR